MKLKSLKFSFSCCKKRLPINLFPVVCGMNALNWEQIVPFELGSNSWPLEIKESSIYTDFAELEWAGIAILVCRSWE